MYGHLLDLFFSIPRFVLSLKKNFEISLFDDTSTIGENGVERDVTRFMKFLTLETREISRNASPRIHSKTFSTRQKLNEAIDDYFPYHPREN